MGNLELTDIDTVYYAGNINQNGNPETNWILILLFCYFVILFPGDCRT